MNTLLSKRIWKRKTLLKAILLVLLVLVVYAGVRFSAGFISERLNKADFQAFSQRIATADHIVVSNRSNSEMAFTIHGEDARKMVRAVANARMWRVVPPGYDVPPFDLTMTFFVGTNVLGAISSNGDLLDFEGKKYHDDQNVIGHLVGRHSGSSTGQTPAVSEKSI